MAVVLTLAVAAGSALVATPVAARVAERLGIVDRPGPLKVHQQPVPYLGGVGIAIGVAATAWWGDPWLLVPLLAALALGLADDIADLDPRLRLAGEVLIGLAAAAAIAAPGPVAWMAVVVFVVVLLNAVNLLDGLDGLAAGTALAGTAGFALVLDGDARVLALGLAGGLAGFLVWNRPPARIYMGDAGSYLVGTGLALLLAHAVVTSGELALASGALLFVAVPVADTSVAIVRRMRAGRPLLAGDRGHLYDQLVDGGRSQRSATSACIAAQALLVVVGIGVTLLAGPAAAITTAVVVALVAGSVFRRFTSPASWAA